MSKSDQRGNPVSYGRQPAIEALDRAFDLMHAYQADPLAAVDTIIADHPEFALAHAFRAGALATAGVDLLQAPQRIVPKLMLPAGVTLVAGADSPLQLEDAVGVSAAATSVDGSLVRLTLSAPSAVFGAHLTADDSVSVSTPGGQTLTVTGTVQALTDWLQAGNLTLRATTAQSLSVELRRAGPDGQMLSAADAALLASGRLDVTLHPATGAVLNPALVLPGRLAVQPGVDSPVVLGAQAFGAGTDETLRATLRVGDGVLAIAGWDAEDSGTLTVQVDGQAQSVTVSAFIADGSGGGQRTFTGTAAGLSALFAQTGADASVRVRGAAQQVLTVTLDRADPGDAQRVLASTIATVTLYGPTAAALDQSAPVLAEVASRLWVTAGTASTLAFGGGVLGAAGANAEMQFGGRWALFVEHNTQFNLAFLSELDGIPTQIYDDLP